LHTIQNASFLSDVRNIYSIFVGRLKGRINFGDLHTDRRIIAKTEPKAIDLCSEFEPMEDPFEGGNDISEFVSWEIISQECSLRYSISSKLQLLQQIMYIS
jgi:hypothetical protein